VRDNKYNAGELISKVTDHGLDSWSLIPGRGRAFLFTNTLRSSLGPTKPPMQRIKGTLTLGVKGPKHEADHLSLSGSDVYNACNLTSVLP
jgi:hypothetical protein